jgi:hypothetical protein
VDARTRIRSGQGTSLLDAFSTGATKTPSLESGFVPALNSPSFEKYSKKGLGKNPWFQDHFNWLVLLDNVESILDVQRLLPSCDHGSVLVTIRGYQDGELEIMRRDHQFITSSSCILGLNIPDALQLLTNYAPAFDNPTAVEVEMVVKTLLKVPQCMLCF